MTRAQVPGVQVAIVDGNRVTSHSYGIANVKTGERVTDETIFEAASISKPVFAYAVMKLVREGKLDLDKSLGTYLDQPYIADPRVAAITARLVLSHRTGFPNWRSTGKDLDIRFDPGTRFSYSGEGVVYLQHVVEAITKEPFDDFMRRTVFTPLGMTHSSYVWQPSYETMKAWGHDDAGSSFRRRKPEGPNAAATLHTTASDLGRFFANFMTDPLARPMLHAEVAVPVNCAVCATNKNPGPPSSTIAWGLGIGLLDNRYFWHWGDDGDFKAYVFGDPVEKRAAVVLTNGSGGLAIAGDIASLALANDAAQRPLTWLDYDRWSSPAKVALHDILTRGMPAVDELRKLTDISESSMNTIGYALLRSDHVAEAVQVFRLNAARHPESWNVWDSLGEGLAKSGEAEESKAAYQKSIELKPK
jgi:CubicO group peptidase (beta-lactamase class C family)